MRSRVGRGLMGAIGACVVVAAVVVPLEVLKGGPQGGISATSGARGCGPSGCAVVDTVRTSPRVTVFYGASCAGPLGAWFLNVVEEAPNGQPRPAYSLHWTFSKATTTVRPNGTITVSTGTQAPSGISMTLEAGILTLKGSGPSSEAGVGTLTVSLTGTGSSRALTLTESGLAGVERALGLVSPFTAGLDPVTVPIRTEKRFKGC